MVLGMPFIFGVVFILGMALVAVWLLVFASKLSMGIPLAGFFYFTGGGVIWFVARDITRRDPFGLPQRLLKLRFLGSAQDGLYRFVPVGKGFAERRRKL